MAQKKRKRKTKSDKFIEKHPFFTLATLPVSLPVMVASDMVEERSKKKHKTSKKKHTAKKPVPNSVWLPRDIRQMDGYQFEEYVAKRLSKSGYTSIDVTPKSGDFGADIIAITPHKIFSGEGKRICFQCKKYSKPVGVKAVQEVIGAMYYYQCPLGCVVSVSGFTQSAYELAQRSNVLLKNIDEI